MLPFNYSQHAAGRRLQIQSWICEDAEKAAGNGAQNAGGTEETPVEVICQCAWKRLLVRREPCQGWSGICISCRE